MLTLKSVMNGLSPTWGRVRRPVTSFEILISFQSQGPCGGTGIKNVQNDQPDQSRMKRDSAVVVFGIFGIAANIMRTSKPLYTAKQPENLRESCFIQVIMQLSGARIGYF